MPEHAQALDTEAKRLLAEEFNMVSKKKTHEQRESERRKANDKNKAEGQSSESSDLSGEPTSRKQAGQPLTPEEEAFFEGKKKGFLDRLFSGEVERDLTAKRKHRNPGHEATSSSGNLAEKLVGILTKKEQGAPLNPEDWNILLVAAFRYLEEHGHEIPAEQLPQLPEAHKKALEAARPGAVARAIDSLKQDPAKRPGHER
jgi:hypothetical protein